MEILSQIQKELLVKLFYRNGYVLDFTTPEFDDFTQKSIGIPLCAKYETSKGGSLKKYIREADDYSSTKLLLDLFEYYDTTQTKEIESGDEHALIYKKCIPFVNRAKELMTVEHSEIIAPLAAAFSSEYLTASLHYMVKMQSENPTEAIGKAKELIESCCKTILEKCGVEYDRTWTTNKYVDATFKLLKIAPRNIPDDIPAAKAMKNLLQELKNIAQDIATIRNAYGSGHGKSSSYKGLGERHAKLAVGSSLTLVHFMWDSYVRQYGDKSCM